MGSKNIYERFAWFHDRVRTGKYPNASSLSRKFEVSKKTAQRDIEFIRDRLSAPLFYDKTLKGYLYEDESFFLPLTYLSSDEITSLLLAKKVLQGISGGSIRNELSSILKKITNILQEHIDEADAVDRAFSFQMIQYSPVDDRVFKDLLGACVKKRSINFTYYSPGNDEYTERTVDPYHVLDYMGTCYLIAFCRLRGSMRSFVLGRISRHTLLQEGFKVREGFNLKEYLNASFGIYKGRPQGHVTLKFSPSRARWIRNQVWHRDQKTKILEDGSLLLSFPVASFFEVEMEVLKHGADVEVISPKSFREQIKATAGNILKIY